MLGELFARMIFSLLYMIKQLFIQIMSKNLLIQINRLQEKLRTANPTAWFDTFARLSPMAIPLSVMCLNYTSMIFTFFNMHVHIFHVQFCCFHIDRKSARNYSVFQKNRYFILLASYSSTYFGIFVKLFSQIKMWFIFFQLHTYKFGLVYYETNNVTCFSSFPAHHFHLVNTMSL